MKLKTVKYENMEGVAIISLNRPESLNAINTQLATDLLTAFQSAQADTGVRVVILRGEGRAFCAGLDLVEKSLSDRQRHDIMNEVFGIMTHSDKYFIAAVQGYAVGYGLELARKALFTIFSEETEIATKMAVDFLDAGEAMRLGVANEVVPLDELDGRAMKYAKKLVLLPFMDSFPQ